MRDWILIFSLLIITCIIAELGFAFPQVFSQTNSTPPVIVLPPNTGTAQPTDITGLASIIVTSVVVPIVGAFLYKKDDKTKEVAKELHGENEFRLEAATVAVKEMNKSLEETDKANVELAKIIKVLFKPFKENAKLKEAYDKYTIDGTPVLQALDEYIDEAQTDLIEYYNGRNDKEDKFDTCNDPIVQKLTVVRNKSKK